MTTCKHCARPLSQDNWGNWLHAEGDQRGRHTCALDPYGFHAEPAGDPCGDHPANPCNGARGIAPSVGPLDEYRGQ